MKGETIIKEEPKAREEKLIREMLETYTMVPPSPKVLKRKRKIRKNAKERR